MPNARCRDEDGYAESIESRLSVVTIELILEELRTDRKSVV